MNEDRLQDLYGAMRKLWEEFQLNHDKFTAKGTKEAAKRARANIQDLRNLVTEYRKESVQASK